MKSSDSVHAVAWVVIVCLSIGVPLLFFGQLGRNEEYHQKMEAEWKNQMREAQAEENRRSQREQRAKEEEKRKREEEREKEDPINKLLWDSIKKRPSDR